MSNLCLGQMGAGYALLELQVGCRERCSQALLSLNLLLQWLDTCHRILVSLLHGCKPGSQSSMVVGQGLAAAGCAVVALLKLGKMERRTAGALYRLL